MVRKALADLSKGDTTVVVVAHRMSTLSICDRVLVLQDGRRLVFEETSSVLDPQRGYANLLKASEIG